MNSWQIPRPGASQVAVRVKTLRASAGDGGVHPWVRKMPWRRAQRSTPVFLPGKFHGQKSLSGFSPVGRKELGMTEVTLTRAPHSWPFLCFIPFLNFPSCLLSSAPFSPPFPAALHLFKRFLSSPSHFLFLFFLALSPLSISPLTTSEDLLLLALRAREFRALCFVLDGPRRFRGSQCFLPGKGASFQGGQRAH